MSAITGASPASRGSEQAAPPEPALMPLRSDVRLLPVADPQLPDWTLFDPARGKYFKVGWVEFEILSRWHLGSAKAIIADIHMSTTLSVTSGQFDSLLTMLSDNELLTADSSEHINDLINRCNTPRGSLTGGLFSFTLFYKRPLFNPDKLLVVLERLVSPLFAYRKSTLTVFFVLALLAVTGISSHAYEFTDQLQLFASPQGLFFFFMVLVFTNVAHEFGHGIMAKHYGCHVRTMGVALIFMIPVCYCDTTDAWKIRSRFQRQMINAGGIIVEITLAVFAVLAWLILPDGVAKSLAFFLAVTSLTTTLLINLNPFLKFDGYFLVADHLQIDNLQHKSFSALQWQLRRVLTGRQTSYPQGIPQIKHRVLCTYAACTWMYRLFLYFAIALMVYSFWFKALGIVLMVGVLTTLILKPVVKEILHFAACSTEDGMNRRSSLTLVTGFLFLLLLVVPIPRAITAPAVFSTSQATTYYAPRASQLSSVSVRDGQLVTSGQRLVTLYDPELDYQRKKLALEISVIQDQLRRQVATGVSDRQPSVGQLDLTSRMEALADLDQQLANLSLHAAHDGQVVGLDNWLRSGVWLSRNEPLFEVVSKHTEVRGYVRAREVQKIASVDGVFRMDGSGEEIPVSSVSVTQDSIGSLEDKSLAVPFGGDIAVTVSNKGEFSPIQDWHLLRMTVESAQTSREQKGYVAFQSEPRSIAVSMASRLYAVLLRESGF